MDLDIPTIAPLEELPPQETPANDPAPLTEAERQQLMHTDFITAISTSIMFGRNAIGRMSEREVLLLAEQLKSVALYAAMLGDEVRAKLFRPDERAPFMSTYCDEIALRMRMLRPSVTN